MRSLISGRRDGIALITVLLVVVAVAAISASAIVMGSNAAIATHYEDRQNLMAGFAEAGVEEARAIVNGTPDMYPSSSFTTIEDGDGVWDAADNQVPGLKRWLYLGPTGVTTGQYGVFGSAVAIVQDGNGNKVIRRQELVQESFAKYAYFTNNEANIPFGSGDQIYGPTHSNDVIRISTLGTGINATFFGPVTTAQVVTDSARATFNQSVTQGVPVINMPVMADLTKLQAQAIAGSTNFANLATLPAGTAYQATTRIEFIAIDLNGNGSPTDADEGFIRVYHDSAHIVVASVPIAPGPTPNMLLSKNCGHFENAGGQSGRFNTAALDNYNPGTGAHNATIALTTLSYRCFLGGAEYLTANDTFSATLPGSANVAGAGWQQWGGTVDSRVTTLRPADKNYLIPITRALNPNFKGVIYVTGKVAISGVVRGRVTLAATGNVIIADDITYSTVPGSESCTDVLGIFAGGDIGVADNTLNSPAALAATPTVFRNYDETDAESIHAVALTLGSFRGENATLGPTTGQTCDTTPTGRGCLMLQGGIIQGTRAGVGHSNGNGYRKRYTYDPCAYTNPPPYFPTTGHFAKARYFEVDPTGFTINGLYDSLTPQD